MFGSGGGGGGGGGGWKAARQQHKSTVFVKSTHGSDCAFQTYPDLMQKTKHDVSSMV